MGRWLVPVALLTLAPKCVLCALAYVGLGAAVAGLDGREFCGASSDSAHRLGLTTTGLVSAGFMLFVGIRCRRKTNRIPGVQPDVSGRPTTIADR